MNLLKTALTFDDVLLVPAHSTTMPKEVSLKTQLTKNISLTPSINKLLERTLPEPHIIAATNIAPIACSKVGCFKSVVLVEFIIEIVISQKLSSKIVATSIVH